CQGRVERVMPIWAGEEEPPEAAGTASCTQPGVRHGRGSPGSRQRPDMLKYDIPNGREALGLARPGLRAGGPWLTRPGASSGRPWASAARELPAGRPGAPDGWGSG